MSRLFTLQIGKYAFEYDKDYGIDKRSGWSLVVDGRVACQLTTIPVVLKRLAEELLSDTDN